MSYNHQDHDFLHSESILPLPPFCGKISIFLFLIVFLFSSLNIFQYSILGSLTKVASSCTKLAKSDKHVSLPKLIPTICTFLFHLSLRLAGNFETRKLLNFSKRMIELTFIPKGRKFTTLKQTKSVLV